MIRMTVIQWTRRLNAFAILGLGAILCGGFAVQIFLGERPCPLCLLQRAGMLNIMVAGLMNLRFGIRSSHYGLALLSSIVGGAVSVRQILLHIAPGTGTYGSPILGLSLYTWAFLTFLIAAIGVSGLLMIQSGDEANLNKKRKFQDISLLEKSCFGLFLAIVLGNLGWTLINCGLGFCFR